MFVWFVFSKISDVAWPEHSLWLEVASKFCKIQTMQRETATGEVTIAGLREANIGSGCAGVGALSRPRASVCVCGCL